MLIKVLSLVLLSVFALSAGGESCFQTCLRDSCQFLQMKGVSGFFITRQGAVHVAFVATGLLGNPLFEWTEARLSGATVVPRV